MIIVSQDRDKIVNFDNVEAVYIQDDEKENFIKCIATDGLDVDLGKYNTEERAKEVLQEIVRYYAVANIGQVYEMPED